MRKSGDPYITHPLAVTTILADIGMTEPTLVAALLHDTVEDTPYTLDQLRADFGDEVARARRRRDQARQGQVRRLRAGRDHPQDDRGDGRATSGCWSSSSPTGCTTCARCATSSRRPRSGRPRETLDIYAPLAHRLGMNTIKWELEDLAFATLHPKIYDEIVRMVAERAPSRDQFLAEVIDQVEQDLQGRQGQGDGHRPAQALLLDLPEDDRRRPRVHRHLRPGRASGSWSRRTATATPSLGVLHSRWNPVLGRFKDYVAMPKFNMYQSLHTTVIGPQGKPVEMQIRTYAMHRRAEYGVAAHWKYKEDGRNGVDTDQPRRPRRHDLGAPAARLAERGRGPGRVPRVAALRDQPRRGLRLHPARRRDRAAGRARRRSTSPTPCTPRSGTTPSAPGSTAGWCRWSRRSRTATWSRSSPPRRRPPAPSRDWLDFVKSPRARSKIRQWFTKERREEAIERGKEQIAKLMRKEGLPLKRVLSHESLTLAAVHFKLADVSALYAAVGEGNLSAQAVVRRVIELHGGDEGAAEDLAEGVTHHRPPRSARRPPRGGDAGVIVKGAPDVWVKLAKCCTPVPPDAILGFVTKGGGVSVHRRTAPTPPSLQSPARAAARGRVGAHRAVDVPGQHPGRGPRPGPAALRHHHGALGRPREHPQRHPLHHPRPGRQEPLHLRDGRGQAPRQRPPRRPRASPASSTPTASPSSGAANAG